VVNKISKFLIFIGRPFYFVFTRIFIILIFLIYLIGHLTRILYSIKLPKVIYPKFKIKKRYLLISGLITLILLSYFLILKDLPSPKNLITRQVDVSTKIYDRNGQLLYTIYKDKNRSLVKLSEIPTSLKLATLAAEDAEFYTHPGFSVRGMFRALKKNLSEGKLQGGSTITQQLVKNALLSSEKTFVRKIRELIVSVGVELNFTKDEILEMYLNEVNYGGNIYGVSEAARQYFGKDVKDLSLTESALIAGLPQSPTKFSPHGQNPDLTFVRLREVLHLMRVNKYITPEEELDAINQKITFAPNRQIIKAPHFVMFVKEKLIEEFGEETVLKGGLSITTTLDMDIQKMAEKVVVDELEKVKKLRVSNAAVVITNPKTGEILAMVGSRDYFNTDGGGNVNVTTRPRQPGSSIKVINYALGLSNGLTLASIIDDSPITFSVPGLPPYSPKNYDGTYRGKITIRQALAESRNIPAVKILASYGVDKMIDLGQKMGITTWGDRSRFGLSLTLGGGETKLIDMAQVYGVIANMGTKSNLKYIKDIHTENDNQNVLDPRVAFLLIDVLRDNNARSRAFGTNSMLVIPNHPEVAVKTGTSNDLKDNLTIGFNQDYLVAVWVGNNDGSSMARIASGITGAAPIWNRIMTSLTFKTQSKSWPIPKGLIYKECYSRFEWFLEEKQIDCPKILDGISTTSD
jgi:penicillin-binding protein 1C